MHVIIVYEVTLIPMSVTALYFQWLGSQTYEARMPCGLWMSGSCPVGAWQLRSSCMSGRAPLPGGHRDAVMRLVSDLHDTGGTDTFAMHARHQRRTQGR